MRESLSAFSLLYADFLFIILPVNLICVRAGLCVPCSSSYSTDLPTQPPAPPLPTQHCSWLTANGTCMEVLSINAHLKRGNGQEWMKREGWESHCWGLLVLVQALSLIDVESAKLAFDAQFPNKSKWSNFKKMICKKKKDDLSEDISRTADVWAFDYESCVRDGKSWLGWHEKDSAAKLDKFTEWMKSSEHKWQQKGLGWSRTVPLGVIRITFGKRQHLQVCWLVASFRLLMGAFRGWTSGGPGWGLPEMGSSQRSRQQMACIW